MEYSQDSVIVVLNLPGFGPLGSSALLGLLIIEEIGPQIVVVLDE